MRCRTALAVLAVKQETTDQSRIGRSARVAGWGIFFPEIPVFTLTDAIDTLTLPLHCGYAMLPRRPCEA